MDIQRFHIIAVGSDTPDMLSKITKELTIRNNEIEAISSLRLGHTIVVVCIIQAFTDISSIKYSLKNIVKNIVFN